MTKPKPQPWYAKFNQPPRSAKQHGRNWKPSPSSHRDPADRADYHTGIDPAKDDSDFTTISWSSVTFYPIADPGPPTIPHAGIRAGELIGHRMWMVLADLQLCSLAHHFIWEPDATIEGDVDKVVGDNFPSFISKPIYGGTYSYNNIEHIYRGEDLSDIGHLPNTVSFGPFYGPQKYLTLHGIAIGTIKMWGEVIEHEKGYRAQYAKLQSIDRIIGPVDIDELRRKYNV